MKPEITIHSCLHRGDKFRAFRYEFEERAIECKIVGAMEGIVAGNEADFTHLFHGKAPGFLRGLEDELLSLFGTAFTGCFIHSSDPKDGHHDNRKNAVQKGLLINLKGSRLARRAWESLQDEAGAYEQLYGLLAPYVIMAEINPRFLLQNYNNPLTGWGDDVPQWREIY